MIDAHQHFWNYNPVRDTWINEEMSVLRRDFLPKDLEPILKQHHIEGTVAVQADQSETETEFLHGLAVSNSFIRGVVGWVDLRSPQVEGRLEYFKSYARVKGFRHVVQAEPDGFMDDLAFRRGVAKLEGHGYTYDILIYAHQLPEARRLVEDFPNQRFVVDHIAKPAIKARSLHPWASEMKKMGELENVWCKLSGMVTEADWNQWKESDLLPYLDVTLESFGTHRLMYGSDWPVCLCAGAYEKQFMVIRNFVAALSEAERDRLLGENAIRFYRL
jgi:L-fuconolactonase